MIVSKRTLVYIFISLMLFELFLMGSGRPLMIGGVTLRMIFYSLSMFFVLFHFVLNEKNVFIDRPALCFFCVFFGLLIFSSFIGLINEADTNKISADFSSLLYFSLILFFSYLSDRYQNFVDLWVQTLKKSVVLLTVGYVLFFILMYFNVLDFSFFYKLLSSESNEVMFRGDSASSPGIFYKSFIFLVIGFFFFFYDKGVMPKLMSLLILISILLTFTRGFLLALIAAFYVINFFKFKKLFYILLPLVCVGILLISYDIDIINVVQRSDSDTVRVIQFEEVIDMVNSSSVIIGHGFGIGTDSRPDHFEITYLELLHKQGIIGLLFWFSLLLFMFLRYFNLRNKTPIAIPIFSGVLVVYIQTLTNPYLNNSMGIGYLMLAFVSLNSLYKRQKHIMESANVR